MPYVAQLDSLRTAMQVRRGALQRTAAARTELLGDLEVFKTQLGALNAEVVGIGESAREQFGAFLAAVTAAASDVSKQVPTEITELRGDVEGLQSAFGELQQVVEAHFEQARSSVSEAASNWEEAVAEIGEGIPEEAREGLTDLRERIESELREVADEILDETRKRARDLLTESQGISQKALDAMTERIEAALQGIIGSAEERLRDGLREIVAKFVERAIGEAVSDITKSLITAQAAVTAAASTSPLTPQIIALRPMVGAVRAVMDAL